MSYFSTGTRESNNTANFQQQLIQQVLLDNGIIKPEHIQKAIEVQKKYISEGRKKIELVSYFIEQEKYSLLVKNPITDELITEVNFPIRKKNKPQFYSTDWFPIGGSGAVLFSDEEVRDIGELLWNPDEHVGITVGKNFSYLQVKSLESSYYFPVLSELRYENSPAQPITTLPLDLTVTLNKSTLYFVDRGSGTLYLFDTLTNKLSGMIHLRPAGSKKTLNVASTFDGKKVFVTDNETPGLFIIDSKNLKIRKQPLGYGNLCNNWADEQWLYLLVDKPNSFPELLVLDTQNLILRATIQLRGELFSKIDDPNDLMVTSPSGKYLLIMTYVNYPSLFTPIVNVVDIENFQLVDQIFLNDKGKPTYISFAMKKPDELVKLKSDLLEILIELGYITEEHVLAAIDSIQGVPPATVVKTSYEVDDQDQGFGFLDEEIGITEDKKNVEDDSISAADKYPILSQYELDPSLMLAFKEEQMRYFSFLPINRLDGKLTLAVANPTHKHTLKQVIEQKFPDLEVVILDFTLNEFNRFMKEFYAVIKQKYDSILAVQAESQARFNEPEEKPQEKKQPKEIIKQPKPELKPLPIPPRSEMPPNLSANIPSDVRLAVREKLKLLDPVMVEEAIIAICMEDFHSIWGIEIGRDVIDKYKNLILRAKEEILTKDYAFIKIENLYGDFSLEIVVNQEKLVVMLKTLSDLSSKPASVSSAPRPSLTKQPTTPNDSDPTPVAREVKCIKCGILIPPEIDICSKCSREAEHQTQSEDIRAPGSPGMMANLNEGNILISDTSRNRTVEINPTGQIVWMLDGKRLTGDVEPISPYSSIRLRSGTTLIADSEGDRIIEFTKSGRIYWELKNREGFRDLFLRRPVHAARLLNGNTLIVDQGNHRVFEINHLDKIVWQYGTTSTVGITNARLYSPSFAQRLINGHTLITDTDNHRVIEIDENDEIVWQYGNPKNKLGSGYGSGRDQLNSPLFAMKIENGNTIIVDTGNSRIIEVNSDKQVTWHYSTSVSEGSPINIIPIRAYRLKSGNTIIFSAEQIVEVGEQGQLFYIRQIEYLNKSPDFKEETVSPQEDKIINDRLGQKTSDRAKQASSEYVKNMSSLTDLEIPLIDRVHHRIVIVNRYKNIVWRFGEATEESDNYLERPQYSELIKDEYVLIADTDNHRVLKIYRPTKEIVWQYGISGAMGSGNNQLGHPRSATITPENNILITDQYSSRVIEVNMSKELVWSFGGWEHSNNPLNAPYYAERCDNNNTLITDWSNHIVIETDSSGNIIWQFGTPKSPGGGQNHLMYPEKAIRTSNGNVLIVDTRNNRVIEVNDSNRIVWEFLNYKIGNSTRQLSNPTNVMRLENGNTVIIHNSNKQVIEVNKNSEIVWQYQIPMERK